MADFLAWWQTGGPAMWVIAALDVVGSCLIASALALALVARFLHKAPGPARVLAVLGFFGCLLPLCAGVIGRQMGEPASPIPLQFGFASAVCCALPAFFAILVAPRRKPRSEGGG